MQKANDAPIKYFAKRKYPQMQNSDKEKKLILDEESIKRRRVTREEAQLKEVSRGEFVCHFCGKRYTNELLFEKHNCKEKIRKFELASPVGQAAFSYYNFWMNTRKFGSQTAEAFQQSRYYNAFNKFAKFTVNTNIGTPETYIRLMVENSIDPFLWIGTGAYDIFLASYDKKVDPLEQVQHSIEYLLSLAEKENLDVSNIFEALGSQRILLLIRQRRLSPWFLLHSEKFSKLLKSLTAEERNVFANAINVGAWANRFQNNEHLRKDISEIAKQLDF